MGYIYLYHLSPSRNRTSITLEGLRRTRLCLGRLVAYGGPRLRVETLAAHVAELHDTSSEYLDLWRVRVDRQLCYPWTHDMWRMTVDIPPHDCLLVRSGLQEK